MAIIKKKMAGKPMMKKRKAQGGINLAKDPNTDEKNALKDVPSEGKMLSNVNTNVTFNNINVTFMNVECSTMDIFVTIQKSS